MKIALALAVSDLAYFALFRGAHTPKFVVAIYWQLTTLAILWLTRNGDHG
jgi:hypothetical protein